jgi:hypothetical protein
MYVQAPGNCGIHNPKPLTTQNSTRLALRRSWLCNLYCPQVFLVINPLTPNDLKGCRAVSPLKIKIPSKNMRVKPTNTPIIYSVY